MMTTPGAAPRESAAATISVVIVNWNGRDHLQRCLGALEQQTRGADQIVVVDNGSSDGSLEMVRDRFPAVTIVPLPTNTGFAVGANTGIAAARGDLIALLNNDVEPATDWLAMLESSLLGSPDDVGYATSKLLNIDGTLIDSAGDWLDDALVPHQRGHLEPDDGRYDAVVDVTSACAAATLYRRAMFDDVGVFDERFFAYYEDVDLCLRAAYRGWRGTYVPAAVARHAMSATSGRIPGFKRYHGTRNIWFLLVKLVPAGALAPLLLRFLATQALWLVGAVRDGEGAVAFRAHRDALRAAPAFLRDRRRILHGARLSPRELIASLPSARTAATYRRHALAVVDKGGRRLPGGPGVNPDAAVRYAAVLPHVRGRILEVGSGSGGVAEFTDLAVTGVDIDFAATDEAVQPGLSRVRADAARLPFADGTFDTVLSVDMLEHLPVEARPAVVAEMVRVTAPGGVVVAAAPAGRWAALADRMVNRAFRRRYGRDHPWLREHLANPPLGTAEVRRHAESAGATAHADRNGWLPAWLLLQRMLMADRRRPRLERLVAAAAARVGAGPAYRRVVVIRR